MSTSLNSKRRLGAQPQKSPTPGKTDKRRNVLVNENVLIEFQMMLKEIKAQLNNLSSQYENLVMNYKKNFLDQLNETVSAQPNGKRSTNKNDIVLKNQKSILNLGFITPIEGQSRTTNEYQNIKTESCDDSFQLSLNREHYIEPIIEIEDDNSSLENNVKQDVVDEPKEIPSSNTLDIDTKVNNYKEKFFDYKNFPVLNDNLKRKRETFDNQVREVNKRSKKEDWIQKEKMKNDDYNKETIDENVNKSPDSVDSGFGSNFNTNTVPIDTKSDKKEKKTDFSQISVEFESKQPSKDKQYNFKVEQKASVVYKDNKVPKGRHSLLENLNQTEEESGNPIRPNSTGNKNYELDLLSLEATYDDFYELKYKKDLPKKLNNSTNNHKTIYNPNIRKMNMTNIINNTMNTRNKKEREKMKAHKCEICTKFYETLGESSASICNHCSRHRTEENPNSTPKGFYDMDL